MFFNAPLELRHAALYWLAMAGYAEKSAGVIALAQAWQEGKLSLDAAANLMARDPIPGHPALPELVSPTAVPRRSMATDEGRAAMIHALAHIEFNAIKVVPQFN